jgi:beta-lactamase regulating signal transducer with metallopeptidase domain
MPAFVIYILKLSVGLAVVFLFYRLLLHRLTFYNWNRWYLLGYTLLAFFIPFLDISPVLEKQSWSHNTIVQWVPLIGDAASSEITTVHPGNFFTTWSIVCLLLLAGMAIMLLRLLVQFISFRRMLKKADFLSDVGMKIFHVDENIIPFSFGNSIFVNRHLHTETELQEIIRHEFVHVKQAHSIDIIWGEVLCLLNWYNPFAWMLKRSIRQNLEFIADYKVLENGIAKKEYQ